jgi:hypothetical protein
MTDHQTSPVGEEAERALDYLLAAAQSVVNDALDVAEEGIHPCDINNEGRKADRMPMAMQSLRYAVRIARRAVDEQAARRAAPALDASGLPPLPDPHYTMPRIIPCAPVRHYYTAEQVRQAQREALYQGRVYQHKVGQKIIGRLRETITDLRAQLARHGLSSNPVDAQKGAYVAIKTGAAPTQPKAQVGSIEDYAQFHHLLDSWMGLSGEHQNDAAPQVAEAWRKFLDYIDAWAGSRAGDAVRLLREARAVLETWKDVVPAVSLCADIDKVLVAAPAPGKQAGDDQEGGA